MKNIRVIVIAFALLFCFLAVFAIVIYVNNKELKNSNADLVQTNKILYQSENFISTLKDIETGTRGFLISGNELFLQPFIASKDKIEPEIAALRKLTNKDSVQQFRLDTLSRLAIIKMGIGKKQQEIRRNKDYVPDNIQPLLLRGKTVMDSIRVTTSNFQQEVKAQMTRREKINAQKAGNMESGFFLLFGSALFLLIVASITLPYFARLRKTQNNTLSQLNTKVAFFSVRIDDIIKGISDPFFALDKNFCFIFLNAAMQNISKGRGSLMGQSFFNAFARYNNTIVGTSIEEVMKTRKTASFEYYENFMDQWLDVTVYATNEGVSVTMRDATKRKASEKELQKTKQLLEETNHVANVGGWEVDLIKEKVTWTSVTRLIHETGPDFIPDLATGIKFYKDGESRDTIIRLVNECIDEGKEWDAELQIITAKGNERWIRTKGKAEFEDGECVRLVGTFQDIDAQKKLSDQLIINERQFRSAFDNSPDGMALVNADGEFTEVNDAYCKILGYTKEEMVTFTAEKITHPDDKEQYKKTYEALLSGITETWRYERRYLHKDGHTIWAEASGSCIRNPDGTIRNFVAQVKDRTEERLLEKELDNERELLKMIINNLPVNLYVKDMESRKILINKREMMFVGAKHEDEILGKNDFDLYPYDSAVISIDEDKKLFRTGSPMLDLETRMVQKDGTETWFLSSKIPLRDADNKVAGLLGISHDITDRKMLEQEQMAFFNLSYDMMCVANVDGYFKRINLAFETALGYTTEELLSKPFIEFIHPDDREGTVNERHILLNGIPSVKFTNRYLCKDGTYKTLEWNSQPVGEGIFAIARDITEKV